MLRWFSGKPNNKTLRLEIKPFVNYIYEEKNELFLN